MTTQRIEPCKFIKGICINCNAEVRGTCGGWVEPRSEVQQVAVSAGRVPLTTVQIRKVYALVPYREIESTVNYLDFARAIEAAHGITPQGDKQ